MAYRAKLMAMSPFELAQELSDREKEWKDHIYRPGFLDPDNSKANRLYDRMNFVAEIYASSGPRFYELREQGVTWEYPEGWERPE